MPQPEPPPLLTVRAAVVILLATIVAGTSGVLTYTLDHSIAAAILAAGTAAGAGLILFNSMIGR